MFAAIGVCKTVTRVLGERIASGWHCAYLKRFIIHGSFSGDLLGDPVDCICDFMFIAVLEGASRDETELRMLMSAPKHRIEFSSTGF